MNKSYKESRDEFHKYTNKLLKVAYDEIVIDFMKLDKIVDLIADILSKIK